MGREKWAAFADEMLKIALSSPTIRGIKDTLDRRTIRKHRKPNPRVLPAPLPSGKLVQ